MRDSIIDYCATIGSDPLLVQGAGGNVSWKCGNTLWVKASGTWLADAENKDIFVPVDLGHLQHAIDSGDFAVAPKVCGTSLLRPSIETLLHTLMPHTVVVHLHAIEILAYLVRRNFETEISEKISGRFRWVSIGYHKPGAALAEAVHKALIDTFGTEVIFLQNHGVVIGGANITEVDHTLRDLIGFLRNPVRAAVEPIVPYETLCVSENIIYQHVPDFDIQQLAIDSFLYDQLENNWTLYPDHIVFLDTRATLFSSGSELIEFCRNFNVFPEIVFIRKIGVFTHAPLSKAKLAQLKCYSGVMRRQISPKMLRTLSSEQTEELIDWDAERYRAHLAK
jgi:rhamnose utilization protein RhaD (predicted bifunctional aldolase and dehydrogenase)